MTTAASRTSSGPPAAEPTPESLGRRLARGAIGGVGAGIPFAVITMWFASTTGGGWLAPLKLISTLVLGADALQAGTAQPWVGAVVHTVISAALGVAFALIAPALRTNGTAALVGALYGLLIYVVNFLVFAPIALEQFTMTNQPFEMVIHIVFGTLLALFFYSSGVRRGERFLALGR